MANLSDDDDDFGELIYRSSHTAKRLKREEDEQKKKPDKNTSTSSLDLDDVSTDREETVASYQPVNVKSIDDGEDTDHDGEAILEQKMPSSSPASVSQTQMMAMLPENPPTLPPLPPTLPPLPLIANSPKKVKPKPKTAQVDECSIEGCKRTARDSGTCYIHGGFNYCNHDGCTNRCVKWGVCNRHGATQKKCTHDGCKNVAIKAGLGLMYNRGKSHGGRSIRINRRRILVQCIYRNIWCNTLRPSYRDGKEWQQSMIL